MEIDQIQNDLELADESELVHSAKKGDTTCFEELVRRYTERIFRVAQHITRSPQDAEDVVQEAFLSAYLHLDNFEERARFSTWLTRIAVNAALANRLRSRRVNSLCAEQQIEDQAFDSEAIPDWAPNPEQLYSRSQLRETLRRALEQLPHEYSIVFVLRDVEGFSIAETATILGLSVAAIKTRLLRARLRLRHSLSKQFARGTSSWHGVGHAGANLLSAARTYSLNA